MIPNCAATRHVHFTLDGSGPANLKAPKLEDWPQVTFEVGEGTRRVDLNTLTKKRCSRMENGRNRFTFGHYFNRS